MRDRGGRRRKKATERDKGRGRQTDGERMAEIEKK